MSLDDTLKTLTVNFLAQLSRAVLEANASKEFVAGWDQAQKGPDASSPEEALRAAGCDSVDVNKHRYNAGFLARRAFEELTAEEKETGRE